MYTNGSLTYSDKDKDSYYMLDFVKTKDVGFIICISAIGQLKAQK